MTNNEAQDAADDQQDVTPDEQTAAGLGHSMGGVDLAHAEQVGSDPPGGLGLDIGGGTEGMGVSEAEDEAADQDDQ